MIEIILIIKSRSLLNHNNILNIVHESCHLIAIIITITEH